MSGADMKGGTDRRGGIPLDYDEMLRMKNAFNDSGALGHDATRP